MHVVKPLGFELDSNKCALIRGVVSADRAAGQPVEW